MEIKKGFTLIELLVTVVILGIVSVLIVQVFFSTVKTNTKEEVLRDTKQNGDYAMEIMTRMIRNARTVDAGCTEEGVPALTLQNQDGGHSIVMCALFGNVSSIASVSAETDATDYLTGTNVTLGASCADASLTFSCNGTSGEPTSVKISFTIWQAGQAVEMSTERGRSDFVTTVSLRN